MQVFIADFPGELVQGVSGVYGYHHSADDPTGRGRTFLELKNT
jgi:hypothetical protein